MIEVCLEAFGKLSNEFFCTSQLGGFLYSIHIIKMIRITETNIFRNLKLVSRLANMVK